MLKEHVSGTSRQKAPFFFPSAASASWWRVHDRMPRTSSSPSPDLPECVCTHGPEAHRSCARMQSRGCSSSSGEGQPWVRISSAPTACPAQCLIFQRILACLLAGTSRMTDGTERRFSADWSQLIVHGHWLVSLLGVRRIEPVLHTDVDTKSHQCSVLPSKRHLSKVSRGTGRSRVLTARRRRISATAFTKRLQCKCKDPRTGLCLTMPRYPRPETHCVRKTSWDTPFSRPPRARSLSQSRLPSNAL